jgi:effector-binding domain-containing protein
MKRHLLLGLLCMASSVFGAYQIEVVTLADQPVLMQPFEVKTADELGPRYGEIFPTVAEHMMTEKIPFSGAPFSCTLVWNPGTEIKGYAGFPVPAGTRGNAEIQLATLPGGKMAKTVHLGNFDKIGEAYEALHQWMKDNNAQANGGPWESYVKVDGTPDEYVTEIYYPIK